MTISFGASIAEGISAAPHKVLRAMDREGFSAFIVGGVIGFGVEVFVTATTKTGELLQVPDLQDRPLEGFVTQLDPASAQVDRHFERAFRPARWSHRAVGGAWPVLKRAVANRCRRKAGAK